FSGSNNHIISASTGTLELGAATLTGNLNANSNDITNVGTINGLAITPNTGVITTGTWNGTEIGATHGGTGQTIYAVGDMLYADTTTSLARLPKGNDGQVLTMQGGLPVWGSAGSGSGGFWQEILGALSPITPSDDLLLGSSATASAKFAFTNVGGGTPTASISGTGNNATYLTGDGTVATTNKKTLTLGSASSGNINLFGFTSGVVHSNASGDLSTALVQNTELQNNSVTITTSTGLSGGGAVALGGTLTLTNTGVTSAIAGTGISLSGGTGAVTISNSGVVSIIGGTGGSALNGSLTLANATTASSTITIDNASTTQKGIAQFNSTNFTDNGSGTINTVQNINSSATPTFGSLTLSADTNELSLGTTHVGLITLGALTGPHTYTLPDFTGTICVSNG